MKGGFLHEPIPKTLTNNTDISNENIEWSDDFRDNFISAIQKCIDVQLLVNKIDPEQSITFSKQLNHCSNKMEKDTYIDQKLMISFIHGLREIKFQDDLQVVLDPQSTYEIINQLLAKQIFDLKKSIINKNTNDYCKIYLKKSVFKTCVNEIMISKLTSKLKSSGSKIPKAIEQNPDLGTKPLDEQNKIQQFNQQQPVFFRDDIDNIGEETKALFALEFEKKLMIESDDSQKINQLLDYDKLAEERDNNDMKDYLYDLEIDVMN